MSKGSHLKKKKTLYTTVDRTFKKALPCNEFLRLFNGFDLLEMGKIAKKTSSLWIYFSLLMQQCDGGYISNPLLG